MPRRQPVRAHRQQVHPFPAVNDVGASGQPGRGCRDGVPERLDSGFPERLEVSLGKHVADLPLVRTGQRDEHAALPDEETARLVAVGCFPGQPEPADVHGRAQAFGLQPGQLAQPREAPVGGDDQIGAQLVLLAVAPIADARDASVHLNELLNLGAENAPKSRVAFRLLVKVVEEDDLRHDHHVGKARLQPRKVHQLERPRGGVESDLAHLCVGQREQAVGQADLIEHLQRGGMHGISAEVAVQVAMELEDGDRHSSPGQKKCQEHSCGAGTDDAAAGFVAHADRLCRCRRARKSIRDNADGPARPAMSC